MKIGHFYFLKDEYFNRFTDKYLMKNKESIGGKEHGRPCFYVFRFDETGIYWTIPISSNMEKFQKIFSDKVLKYGACDTIVFGNIMGNPKTFLIQNMCPTTDYYIKEEYFDFRNKSVILSEDLNNELIFKAKRVLNLQRKGVRVIIPDVMLIEKELMKDFNR